MFSCMQVLENKADIVDKPITNKVGAGNELAFKRRLFEEEDVQIEISRANYPLTR